MWELNAAVMLTMGANFLVMAVGSVNFKARLIGTVINCLLVLLNIGGGLWALICCLAWGDFCTSNDLTVSEYIGDNRFARDGHTYADDGDVIFAFAIVQLVIGALQLIVFGCPLYLTEAVGEEEYPPEFSEIESKSDLKSQGILSEVEELESVEEEPRQKQKFSLSKKSNKSMNASTASASTVTVEVIPGFVH